MRVGNVGVKRDLTAGEGFLQISREIIAAQQVRRNPIVRTKDVGVLQDLASLVEVVERKFKCSKRIPPYHRQFAGPSGRMGQNCSDALGSKISGGLRSRREKDPVAEPKQEGEDSGNALHWVHGSVFSQRSKKK